MSANTTDKNEEVLRIKSRKGERQQQGEGDDTNKAPPAVLIRTVKKGVECRYNYVKTLYSDKELDDFRFEQQCRFPKRDTANTIVLQLRCQAKWNTSRSCPFALLAWWPDADRKRIHVYAHGEHNHRLASAEERLAQKRSIWPDNEEPPADFCTEDGRYWTYVETSATKVIGWKKQQFFSLLTQLKLQYQCYDPHLGKQSTIVVRRATLPCTTTIVGFFGPSFSSNCNFQLLIQRTDRGRYHIYASDKHTCLHRNKVTIKQPLAKGKPQGEEEKKKNDEKNKEEDGQEVQIIEDEWEEMEEEVQGQEEDGQMEEELKWDEFEEEEEDGEDEENGGNFNEEEENAVQSSNSREQKGLQGMLAAMANNDDDDEATMPTSTAAMKRARNPDADNDEAADGEGVQFVDFVDHPKYEVVKMHRLGEQKREPAIDAAIITLDEEEKGPPRAKAVQQKRMIGMPKREFVKEEKEVPAPDEGQQPPRHQQQQGANNNGNGMAAAIQVPSFVRERWWAEPNRGRVEENVVPNNEPRLLRERKRRVDYRNIDDLI